MCVAFVFLILGLFFLRIGVMKSYKTGLLVLRGLVFGFAEFIASNEV